MRLAEAINDPGQARQVATTSEGYRRDIAGKVTQAISAIYADAAIQFDLNEYAASHFGFCGIGDNFPSTVTKRRTMKSAGTRTSMQGCIVVTAPPCGFHGC